MRRVLPILFNTEMVTATLDGRKTATRRLIKFPKNNFTGEVPQADNIKVYKNTLLAKKISFFEEPHYSFDVSPPCHLGDILYVREKWCRNAGTGEYYYAANRKSVADVPYGLKWHPSIHMPKEAARIWLEVTNVGVERLQEMTLDDFLQEGIAVPYEAFNDPDNAYMQAKSLFAGIWDSTISRPKIGIYGWKANPWVWVIEFERCYKEDRHL